MKPKYQGLIEVLLVGVKLIPNAINQKIQVYLLNIVLSMLVI